MKAEKTRTEIPVEKFCMQLDYKLASEAGTARVHTHTHTHN